MGKRRGRARSQLLSTMTKKQKKHLRDFGEEHPFYDRSRCAGSREGWFRSGRARAARCRPGTLQRRCALHPDLLRLGAVLPAIRARAD